jgi:phosphatidylinositol-3-phosphatase
MSNRLATLLAFAILLAGSAADASSSGVQVKLGFSPKSLDFGRVPLGTSKAAPPITLINRKRIAISIGPFTFSDPQFSEIDDCRGMLRANGGTCQVTVVVKPTAPNRLKATMGINDGARGSAQQVGLKALAVLSHVVIVVEENRGFSEVVGNPNMPYIGANNGTSLQQIYGLAVNYYANTHPSIGNYFVLTSGVDISDDDGLDPAGCGAACDVPNVFRSLTRAGVSWKIYAEDLPSIGYTGGDSGEYVVRHNPAAYYALNDPVVAAKANNIVPLADPDVGLAADLANDTLPAFAFIEPNGQHDQHDGTDAEADQWLQTNLDPLLRSPKFGDGLLIVWWDEGDSDACSSTVSSGCGGQVALILAGRPVKTGYRGGRYYRHGGTLRLMYDALGLGAAPGSGARSNSMSDFFGP